MAIDLVERRGRHRRLRDPRRGCGRPVRLFGLLGRRRQRRRLRRPHHRGALWPTAPRDATRRLPATATWCSARRAGFGAAIDLANVAAGTGGFVIHGAGCGRPAPAIRSPRPATSTATASTTSSSGRRYADGPARRTRTDAGDSYVVFGKAGGFGAAIDLATVAAGTGGFVIHGAGCGRSAPAVRSPRPATSTATASTTSSSGRPVPTAPRAGRALCRRQLCGVRQGRRLRRRDRSRRRRRRHRRLRDPRRRMRTTTPAVRSPRPATSTATASTT